jgi:c-di-GMP-binding flagellar brake protein YcgR
MSSDETDAAGDERRREVRLLSANLINYSELSEDRLLPSQEAIFKTLGTARTQDLSAGGCRMLCFEPLPAGAHLELKLQLGDMVIECVGRVVRSDEDESGQHSVGVEFEDLSELARDGIRVYLEFKGE